MLRSELISAAIRVRRALRRPNFSAVFRSTRYLPNTEQMLAAFAEGFKELDISVKQQRGLFIF
jgi:hypothetical protein